MQTFSGIAFDLLHPTENMVEIIDIAHHLSQINRFTGATRQPYSVAQHSVLVASVLPGHLKLYGLLHDAGEAYTTDISTPMKEVIRRMESAGNESVSLDDLAFRIDCEIYRKLCGDPDEEGMQFYHEQVKEADLRMMITEKRDLLNYCPREWGWAEGLEPYDFKITPWPAQTAEEKFLEVFHKLTAKEEAVCL